MAERILCESGLSVRIDGSGDRTLVVVKNDTVARFWADTSELEGVITGVPVLLTALEGSCLLQCHGAQVQASFSVHGHETQTCAFPVEVLQEALSEVRLQREAEGYPAQDRT